MNTIKSRIIASILAAAVVCGCLAGCSAVSAKADSVQTAEPAVTLEPVEVIDETPMPEETPAPVIISFEGREYDEQETSEIVVAESAENIMRALELFPNLVSLDMTAFPMKAAELAPIFEAYPDVKFEYIELPTARLVEFEGNEYYDLDTTELAVTQSKDNILTALELFPNLDTLDLTALQMTEEEIDRLIESYPDVFFAFMMKVGGYYIRTDLQCFSTLCTTFEADPASHYYNGTIDRIFKYCTRLIALDIGHNYITDISLIGNLKELKYLILADERKLVDLSPLAQLPQLEYLEVFSAWIATDYSFLYSLTNLRALNVSNQKLNTIDWIENMPNLETLWIFKSSIPEADILAAIEAHPEINIAYKCKIFSTSVTCCGWRATDINICLRQAFREWRNVKSVNGWCDVTYVDSYTPQVYSPVYEH